MIGTILAAITEWLGLTTEGYYALMFTIIAIAAVVIAVKV